MEYRLRRLLMAEGFLSEVFVALTGGVFLTGLALLLGANPVTLSLLSAVPFLAQGAQFLAPVLERRLGTKRRVVVPAFALGRLLWLVPVALALAGLVGPLPVAVGVLGIALMASSIMVGANGWMTWLAEVIPKESRAHLFGRRAWGVALGTLLAMPTGAVLIDAFSARGLAAEAYGLLGLVAVLCGVLAALVAGRFPEPPRSESPVLWGLRPAFRLFRRRRYRQIVGLFSLWNVALGIPAPFWTLYMLERLDMSFFLVSLHSVVVLVVRLLTNDFWARVIDRIGSHRVLIGCGLAISSIPLLWLLPRPGHLAPVFFEAVLSGVVWTGFNQAAFIQPLAVIDGPERASGLALFNVATGSSLFLAALGGGALLSALGTATVTGFFVLFVSSSVLRAVTALLALRLAEPGMTLRGFIFNFVGYGVLRRPSVGRQWLVVDDDARRAPEAAPRGGSSSGSSGESPPAHSGGGGAAAPLRESSS